MHGFRAAFTRKELPVITRTLALLAFALLLVVALVTPVGANMLLRGGFARVTVTEPEILILLGAAMVAIGVSTRRFLSQRRLPGRSRV